MTGNPEDTFQIRRSLFACGQGSEAEAIANHLKNAGAKIFGDRYEQASLWGKHVYDDLSKIYQDKPRYSVMLFLLLTQTGHGQLTSTPTYKCEKKENPS